MPRPYEFASGTRADGSTRDGAGVLNLKRSPITSLSVFIVAIHAAETVLPGAKRDNLRDVETGELPAPAVGQR